jgi:signal transduction histidine kinase
LRHAFSEIMLNALQANTADAAIGVTMKTDQTQNGTPSVLVEVADNGKGFSSEALTKVPTPFFTTKTVGLGLGLSVCRKILQMHHGSMEIPSVAGNHTGLVRVRLPFDPNP